MDVYLASPRTQQQASIASGMNVLLSFACWSDWLLTGRYVQTFSSLLIDSGAFSELNGKKKIDLAAYKAWSEQWRDHAAAIAGLDSISGDWKRSLRNYAAIPWSFPTWHDTDPPELLDELIAMARERRTWIGIGLKPPRDKKGHIVRSICERIPEDLHIHGWALRRYTGIHHLDSVDSTDWWRVAMSMTKRIPELSHLTYGECLEIVVKRYQRWERKIEKPSIWRKLL